jgi:hypothetical protein
MLRQREKDLLYFLARDYYSGSGEIVDAGSCLGSSTRAFAQGLEESRVATKASRVHAFDRFVAEDPFLEQFVGHRGSFRDAFVRHLGDLLPNVTSWQGDFRWQSWDRGGIEILFVDVASSHELNRHLLLEFFPALIPGVSLVIHQDYHLPLLPFIHVTMEALCDHFEIVDGKVDDSIVFRLRSKIPSKKLSQVSDYVFTKEEQLQLMDRAIARLAPEQRAHVKLARAYLCYLLYGEHRLREELQLLDQEYPGEVDEHWGLYRHQMVPQAAGLA